MPDALHCRLMQICVATYSGTAPDYLDVAWTDIVPGTKATACGKDYDFGFVGEIANPRPGITKAVVIAFRGTLEPFRLHDPDPRLTLHDWLNNTASRQEPFPEAGLANVGVHQGFHRSLELMWPKIRQTVEAPGKPGPQTLLLITGHSKGGAIANLAAMQARHVWPAARVEVVTFAGARAGDQRFQAAYNQAVPNSVRYESWPDPVPELPPGPQGSMLLRTLAKRLAKAITGTDFSLIPEYYPVGTRVPTSAGWGADVWIGIGSLLAGSPQAAIRTVHDTHRIGPGTGYGTLACPPPK